QGRVKGFSAPRGTARQALQGVFWANFVGPEYVQVLGEERLDKSPAYKVEKLPDGGMLLLLSESPFDASKDEYQARKQQLRSYLGVDAFNGKLLPRFRGGPGRKVRDASPLTDTGGIHD